MIHALQRQTPGTYMTPTKHFRTTLDSLGADEVLHKDTKLLLDCSLCHISTLFLTKSLDEPANRHFLPFLLVVTNMNCVDCVYCLWCLLPLRNLSKMTLLSFFLPLLRQPH